MVVISNRESESVSKHFKPIDGVISKKSCTKRPGAIVAILVANSGVTLNKLNLIVIL